MKIFIKYRRYSECGAKNGTKKGDRRETVRKRTEVEMIFIVGGRAQGKRKYALSLYRDMQEQRNAAGSGERALTEEQLKMAASGSGDAAEEKEIVCDGAVCTPQELGRAVIIDHLHEFIRRYPGKEPQLRRDAVVICDEVGSGIVPVDREEREFRERVGRIGCRIAEEADSVIRVVYGIPVRLK